jgi:hypothetical protein
MNPTILDFESCLIRPGLILPPPAIATTYHPADGARLWLTHQLPEMLERVLDDASPLAGHDLARFDAGIIAAWFPQLRPKLWKKFEDGKILDTLIAERIIQIQRGEAGPLALGALGRKYNVDVDDKEDPEVNRIRMTFGQYLYAREISPEHARYALRDATSPATIFERQMATNLVALPDLAFLCRQSFWLSLVAARGFRTDLDHVRVFEQRVKDHVELLDSMAKKAGILRSNGVQDTRFTQELVYRAYCDLERDAPLQGFPFDARVPLTKTGLEKQRQGTLDLSNVLKYVAADKLVLADSGDDELEDLETWKQWRAAGNKDVELLLRGSVEPVHTKFALANTLRATSSDPNGQNLGKGKDPKATDEFHKHRVWGVRECIAPRPGLAFVTTDIKGLENGSLAQIIIWATGIREFANKINGDPKRGIPPLDIHSELGAEIAGIPLQEFLARRKAGDKEIDELRDAAKPGNFGLAGGMTRWQTLQSYARKGYNVKMSDELAQRVCAAWRRKAAADGRLAWLDFVKRKKNANGRFDIELPLTSIVRRNVSRTEASNNPFQCLGMRVASVAGWKIIRGQYLTGECPGNMAFFVHDAFDSECQPDDVDEVAAFQDRCIEEAGREVTPDVIITGDSRAVSNMSKSAKASFNAEGKLIPTRVTM